MNNLPPHLAQTIGKAAAARDVPYIVAALEAHNVAVRVVRLQLGDMRGKGLGRVTEIYRSAERVQESQ